MEPHESPEYQAEIERLAALCTCQGVDKPCDGLLAGGLCDNLDFSNSDED